MKIALLLIGRLDTFENMHPYLKEYILDPLKPDIFFSGHPNNMGIDYCEQKIRELWSPKKYLLRTYTEKVRREIHPNDEIFNSNKRNECTPNTWLSGIFNVQFANKLKSKYEFQHNIKYDVVIKARTDLQWYSTISEEDLNLAKLGNILIPTAWDFKSVNPISVSDVLAITDTEGMNKYASLIDCVDQYFSEGNTFHPESYVGIHINRTGLNRIEINHGIDNTGWCVVDPNRKKS